MKTIWLMLVLVAVVVNAQRRLALPDPRSCANRECLLANTSYSNIFAIKQ